MDRLPATPAFVPRLTLLLSMALAANTAAADEVLRMLSPGFVVEELPVELPNLNNLRFSPAGQLTALGYNGRVYLLDDRDGDGLEESFREYWNRDTLSVPVGMTWAKEGLYVSSHGKVSLLKDTDGDGVADEEEIVAQGWPPTDVASGGVDATAVTLDADGNLYFGLLCADYSNPYRIDNDVARYDRHSPRGTIVRLPRGKTQLETICTGVRVPYTLAFNRLGDLFLTDQEGATWLPEGNPLDELNHIQPGRHYGFPPRHEQHLPDVLDEPPVAGFGPQHQSTTGLIFNEARDGQRPFGPAAWHDDALVTGFSRGKLWRVRLVKTELGYIGQPTLVAVSTMLLADAAISPRGDLYVCCHSGPPDWGTGPQGPGKLFRIRLADGDAPQPMLAWPGSPLEVHVAFDRPVPESLVTAAKPIEIAYGDQVRAADRFETLKPPYAAVEQQSALPRRALPAVGATWSDDRRTLTIATDPQPADTSYAVTIPLTGVEQNAIDVSYTLKGVQAHWQGAESTKSIWLPHFDLDVSQAVTKGSAAHAAWFTTLREPGTLTLESKLDVPPGSAMTVFADRPFTLIAGDLALESHAVEGGHAATWSLNASGELIEFTTNTDQRPLIVHASYHTQHDPTERPLTLERWRVPWAPGTMASAVGEVAEAAPVAIDGDPVSGAQVFFGERAKCAMCHAMRGRGATHAPDLGNLVHRDRDSVLRDIRRPSDSINPDFVNYQLALRDGRVLQGIVKADGPDRLRVVDANAKVQDVDRDQVETIAPLATSAMPTELLDQLSEHEIRDLLAYLLTEPVTQTAEGTAFPTRTRDEIQRLLAAIPAKADAAAVAPLEITLVTGAQDHGPGEHDYPAWSKRWQALLSRAEGVTVHTAADWPSQEQWEKSQVVVFYFWNHDWSPQRFAELDQFLARGGGAVVLHSATISDDAPEELAKRWGLASQPVTTKYRHGPLELHFSNETQELTQGYAATNFLDETYWPLIGDRGNVTVLATAVEEGAEHPMVWTHEKGQGRVFATVLGHYTGTLDDPLFRMLVLRGIAWAGRQQTDRLQGLVEPNAVP